MLNPGLLAQFIIHHIHHSSFIIHHSSIYLSTPTSRRYFTKRFKYQLGPKENVSARFDLVVPSVNCRFEYRTFNSPAPTPLLPFPSPNRFPFGVTAPASGFSSPVTR